MKSLMNRTALALAGEDLLNHLSPGRADDDAVGLRTPLAVPRAVP